MPTDLMFYEKTTGYGEFYTTNGGGGINFLRGHDDWRRTLKSWRAESIRSS